MTFKRIATYISILVCIGCNVTHTASSEMILPEPSYLEKILTRGTLNISTFYNPSKAHTQSTLKTFPSIKISPFASDEISSPSPTTFTLCFFD